MALAAQRPWYSHVAAPCCAKWLALAAGLAVLMADAPMAIAGTLVFDLQGRPVWVDRQRKKPRIVRKRPTESQPVPSKTTDGQSPPKPTRRAAPKTRDLFAGNTPSGEQLPPLAPLEAGLTERTETEWSNLDIHKARTACNRSLAKLTLKAKPLPPIKRGQCGDPAPIALEELGGKNPVTFKPAAKINCAMVVALDKWLKSGLQPAARRHLKTSIREVSVMSDYSCRNAYGRKNGRLSEHGLANALDIGGFVTRDGKRTLLLSHWGPTGRDIARHLEAEAVAKAKAKQEAADAKAKQSARAATQKNATQPALLSRGTIAPSTGAAAGQAGIGFNANKLGGPPTKQSLKKAPSLFKAVDLKRMYFLKQAHRSACKIFGTVLGPEANNAHRNHFHVDLAPRKRSNYCR